MQKLLVVSPIKNEEKTISYLLDSILRQTISPRRWLIVDDNSIDKSMDIVSRYISCGYIDILNYEQSSERKTGGHVVDLVNYGLNYADKQRIEWNILLKIDGDIEIQNDDYFEFILCEFEKYPKLGISSGSVFHYDNNKKVIETKYLWHTQGQSKFYRRKCLEDIGGLRPWIGWDGIDDILARDMGYDTVVYPQFELRHFYKTRTRKEEGGIINGLKREAIGYRNRSYPLILYIFKTVKLLFDKPYIIKGVYFFIIGMFYIVTRKSKLTKNEKKVVRKFLINRLLGKV